MEMGMKEREGKWKWWKLSPWKERIERESELVLRIWMIVRWVSSTHHSSSSCRLLQPSLHFDGSCLASAILPFHTQSSFYIFSRSPSYSFSFFKFNRHIIFCLFLIISIQGLFFVGRNVFSSSIQFLIYSSFNHQNYFLRLTQSSNCFSTKRMKFFPTSSSLRFHHSHNLYSSIRHHISLVVSRMEGINGLPSGIDRQLRQSSSFDGENSFTAAANWLAN